MYSSLAELGGQTRRTQQVASDERADRDPREEPRPVAGLQPWIGIHALHDGGVEAEPRGEGEAAPVDDAEVDLVDAPVVGHAEQVLGRVDQLAGDAEHLAEHVGRAAGQAGQWGGGAEQSVGGLVDGAVPTEGDDHVVALVGGLAAELGSVAAGLGVDGVHLEASLQGVRRRGGAGPSETVEA